MTARQRGDRRAESIGGVIQIAAGRAGSPAGCVPGAVQATRIAGQAEEGDDLRAGRERADRERQRTRGKDPIVVRGRDQEEAARVGRVDLLELGAERLEYRMTGRSPPTRCEHEDELVDDGEERREDRQPEARPGEPDDRRIDSIAPTAPRTIPTGT